MHRFGAAIAFCVCLALPLSVFAQSNIADATAGPVFDYSCSVTYGTFNQAREGILQADSLRFDTFAGNASGKFSNGMGYIFSVSGQLSSFVSADSSITLSDRVLTSATVGGISGNAEKEHTLASSTWHKNKLLGGGCIFSRR